MLGNVGYTSGNFYEKAERWQRCGKMFGNRPGRKEKFTFIVLV